MFMMEVVSYGETLNSSIVIYLLCSVSTLLWTESMHDSMHESMHESHGTMNNKVETGQFWPG